MNIRIFLKALVFFRHQNQRRKYTYGDRLKKKNTIKESDNDVVNGGKCAHWSVGERGIFAVNWDDLSLMARGQTHVGMGFAN